LECFASGDEFFNYLHDENGFLIKRDPDTGYYVYVTADDTGKLTYTKNIAVSGAKYIPDLDLTSAPLNAADLSTGLKHEDIDLKANADLVHLLEAPPREGGSIGDRSPEYAALRGVMTNVVVLISFADEDPAVTPEYDAQLYNYFNGAGDANSGSLKDYINVVSEGEFMVNSTIVGMDGGTALMYQDDKPRAYYMPNYGDNPIGYSYEEERTIREHTLLKNAIEAIDGSPLLSGRNLDFNDDGEVDGVTFIITGDVGGWSDLLWPHQWSLYSYPAYLNGKQVFTYSFQLQDALDVSVLAHESLHTFSFPDLYRYYDMIGGEPVYGWDIMAANTPNPQIPFTYSRNTYAGWGNTPVEITQNGRYTLAPLGSSNGITAYSIPIPDTNEFIMLEYRSHRNGTGFDNWFHEDDPRLSEYMGLLVSRIYPDAVDGNRNGGYQDVTLDIDEEGNFFLNYGPYTPDEIYVYRPNDGTYEAYSEGWGAYRWNSLSAQTGRTGFGLPKGEEDPVLGWDNTIYTVGEENTGYVISNVSEAGDTISFDVTLAPEENTTAVLNYVAGNNGSLTAALADKAFKSGDAVKANDSIVFTAKPDENYVVDEWIVDGEAVEDAAGTEFTFKVPKLESDTQIFTVQVSFKLDDERIAPAPVIETVPVDTSDLPNDAKVDVYLLAKDAKVYYTLDGTMPDDSDTRIEYTDYFTVEAGTLEKANIRIIAYAELTDGGIPSVYASRDIVFNAAPASPVIKTASLPAAILETEYSQTLQAASATAVTWELAGGALPDGLKLDKGVIAGTPTKAGEFAFTVKATNDFGSTTAELSITVKAKAEAPVILTEELPDGIVFVDPDPARGVYWDEPYSVALEAKSDGNVTWSIIEGELPYGLLFNELGEISGFIYEEEAIKVTFTVKVEDEFGSDEKELTIDCVMGKLPVITNTELPTAYYGVPYSAALEVESELPLLGVGLERGELPDGLEIDSYGVITGTPVDTDGKGSETAAVQFYAQLMGSLAYTVKDLTINVQTVEAPSIFTRDTATVDAGIGGEFLVRAFGTEPVFSLSDDAPEDVSIDEDGLMTIGTKLEVGEYVFDITATNPAGASDTQEFTLIVVPQRVVKVGVQSNALIAGQSGFTDYALTTVRVEDGSYTATVTGLPAAVRVLRAVEIKDGAGLLSLYGTAAMTAGESALTVTIDGVTSDEFALIIAADEDYRDVSVGEQTGTLVSGKPGSVTFPVTTFNVADGAYTAVVKTLPSGVTAGQVEITDGKGVLTLTGDATTKAGVVELTAEIDGGTSDKFTLTITDAATVKSVSVGAQTGQLMVGSYGIAEFPVTTVLVEDGEYPANITALPVGVGLLDEVIVIKDGKGTLTLYSAIDAEPGITEAALTLDGIEAKFTVTVGGGLEGFVEADGSWYYYIANVKQTGFIELEDGSTIYADPNADGALAEGWTDVSGEMRYFGEKGLCVSGWVTIDGVDHYFFALSVPAVGFVEIDGTWYFLLDRGVPQSAGFHEDEWGVWRVVLEGGILCPEGLHEFDGVWRFVRDGAVLASPGVYDVWGERRYVDDGALLLSPGISLCYDGLYRYVLDGSIVPEPDFYENLDGYTRYIAEDGVLLPQGWHYIDGSDRYLLEGSVPAEGELTVDGVTYIFELGIPVEIVG
jgi:M6 family metalloprotease-like protein